MNVTDWQKILKELGYYDREITGVFDSHTKSATIELQKALRIESEGVVNTDTWDRANLLRDRKEGV